MFHEHKSHFNTFIKITNDIFIIIFSSFEAQIIPYRNLYLALGFGHLTFHKYKK